MIAPISGNEQPVFMTRSNRPRMRKAAPRGRGQFLSEGSDRAGECDGQPEAVGRRPSEAVSTSWGTLAG